MRSLWVFGITAAFIVCAFVPPSEANFKALASRARVSIEQRARSSLVGSVPQLNELRKASSVIKNLARDPRVSVLVENLNRGFNAPAGSNVLKESASIIDSVLPTAKKKAATVISNIVTAQKKQSPKWLVFLRSETDPAIRKQLDRIDWAEKKDSISLCRELEAVPQGTTLGDFIALCVAKISRSPDRCAQISDAALKSVCQDELAGEAQPLSGLRLL